MAEWMCTPHELAVLELAPDAQEGSAPVRLHEKVCEVLEVVIGPTLPATDRLPV